VKTQLTQKLSFLEYLTDFFQFLRIFDGVSQILLFKAFQILLLTCFKLHFLTVGKVCHWKFFKF
jgi:hypothetical protein